jgi:hypothetical protein
MADPLDRVQRIIRGLTMAQHVKKAGVPAAQAPETEARVRLKFRVRCIVPGKASAYVGGKGDRKLTAVPEY